MPPKPVHPDAHSRCRYHHPSRCVTLPEPAPFSSPTHFLALSPGSSSSSRWPVWQARSRLSQRCNLSSVIGELGDQQALALNRRRRLTTPLSWCPALWGDRHSTRYAWFWFGQQNLEVCFASFVYMFFFKLVSCIDMKLEFYAILVFLWSCLILSCSLLATMNSYPMSAAPWSWLQ